MENNSVVLCEIYGLNLKPNTTMVFSDYIITNDFENEIKKHVLENVFIHHFGNLNYYVLKNNVFLILKTIINEQSDIHFINLGISSMLNQLWLLKDCSVFINNFYYTSLENHTEYTISKLNFNIYNSEGKIKIEDFSKEDIIFCENHLTKSSEYRNEFKCNHLPVESFHTNFIMQSQNLQLYDDFSKFQRAELFIMKARSESLLPIKITNYISFLESLFSTSTAEIQHQVSERAALFLRQFDKSQDSKYIYNTIKSCYSIRSKYIHGDVLGKNDTKLDALSDASKKIDNICRDVLKNIIKNNIQIFTKSSKEITAYFIDLVFQAN